MIEVEVGDIVWIKGQINSPTLTVEHVNDVLISCLWFDSNEGLHRDKFLLRTLTKEKPKKH